MAKQTASNRRSSQKIRTKDSYVSGNTVKKLQVAGPYSNEALSREEYLEERNRRRAEERKNRRINRMNFLYTVAVVGVVTVIFTICYQYLNVQSTVKTNADEISKLQTQLTEITVENDQKEQQVNASINYDAIYKTAVEN